MIKNGTFTGKQGKNHIQGMAVDEKRGYLYFSFTTRLIKTKLSGEPVGSVSGLVGHLGCICLDPADGRVYGSLEYKHDGIGRGILRSIGAADTFSDGFYVAVFDADRITRPDMDAEGDGIMTACFLPEALADYEGAGFAPDGSPLPHRYGCSGIDGVCIAPPPGGDPAVRRLYVADGVYGDVARNDNDHQILLSYPLDAFLPAAQPLKQAAPHRAAPAARPEKYFVFTGNTEYGVQNLAYDATRSLLFMAVYAGKKPAYQNWDVFAADLTKPAAKTPLRGPAETGAALTLCGADSPEEPNAGGWRFSYGQYGFCPRPDGTFYIAQPETAGGEQAARVFRFAFDPETGFTRLT